MYGRTAINARKLHQNKFKCPETFEKYSSVSSPGLIPGIYHPLF
jgi:hypothetical protein